MKKLLKDSWGDQYTEAQAIELMKEFEHLDLFFEQVQQPELWKKLYEQNKREIDKRWNR